MILFSLHFVNTVILSTPTCWRGDELKVFRCFGANDGPAQVLMNPNTDQENHTADQLWESRQLTDPESAWAPKQGTSQPVSQSDRQTGGKRTAERNVRPLPPLLVALRVRGKHSFGGLL